MKIEAGGVRERTIGERPAVMPDLYQQVCETIRQALCETLARVAAQESLNYVMPPPVKPARLPHVPLTARERQILERIKAGESNKAIARALDLSLHTVKRHVANILTKLGVSSRLQAATWMDARH